MEESKYIVDIDEAKDEMMLARYNQTETWFCDYEKVRCKYMNVDYEIGQEVYSDKYGFTVVNSRPNKRVVELINSYKIYRQELSEKYKSCNNAPSIKKLINNYLSNRVIEGKKVNNFVADATYIFCLAMGIKVRDKNGNSYLNKGFMYKEDVLEIIDAIYRYIDEVLMHDTRKNRIEFYLYGRCNMNYSMLKLWIEQNTHFSKEYFTSDIQTRINALSETGQYDKSNVLMNNVAIIDIAPYYLKYYHDGDLLTCNTTIITKDTRDINFTWNYSRKDRSYRKKLTS